MALHKYSRTSIAGTPMARLPWLIPTRFESLRNFFNSSRKQMFKEIFLFYHEVVCCVYSLESLHRGNSNEYTEHTIIVYKIENKFPKLSRFTSWPGSTFNTQWLELPLFRAKISLVPNIFEPLKFDCTSKLGTL